MERSATEASQRDNSGRGVRISSGITETIGGRDREAREERNRDRRSLPTAADWSIGGGNLGERPSKGEKGGNPPLLREK